MGRIYLNVPFDEKDDAKRLGARWDAQRKSWYVLENHDHDLSQFVRWGSPRPDFLLRAAQYYLAETTVQCFMKNCQSSTRVYSVLLPKSFETWEPEQHGSDVGWWLSWDNPSFVSYAMELSESVRNDVMQLTKNYYPDFSKTMNSIYWMNHCDSCGIKQGDWPLHDEPGGGFFPTDTVEARRITLRHISNPFLGHGGVSQDDGELYLLMQNMSTKA